ncbi:MAG: hypothetical protein AAB427_06070 [Chloroflexota bacterium]
MSISASDVKKLRQATGAAMLDCKTAIEQNGGDFEKANEYLEYVEDEEAIEKIKNIIKKGDISATL